jgi:NAD(P)H-hydrate epimerase
MTTTSFITDRGVSVPAVTTDQMREVDRVAIEELGPNLYQMMENAGRNLAEHVIEMVGDGWTNTLVVVLAGTGGNGGGGICAARHLANRGANVTVVVSDRERLAPVPEQQLSVYRAAGGRVVPIDGLDGLEPGIIVDAIIGYSLGGAPTGPAARLIDWIPGRKAPVLSLDVPSGIDAGSGDAHGNHVRASATLTLALPKTGLDVAAVGAVTVADIGIPREVYVRAGIDVPVALFGDRYRVPVQPS